MMLIRNLLAVALLATPVASNATSLDFNQLADGVSRVVKAVDTVGTSFEAHRRWRPHWHRPTGNGTPRPGPNVPEPTAALLFGLGALAVGVGIRRRR